MTECNHPEARRDPEDERMRCVLCGEVFVRHPRKWEYMILCPDSDAGIAVLLQETGEEGWEACCSWAEVVVHYAHESKSERRVNHILFKRPA